MISPSPCQFIIHYPISFLDIMFNLSALLMYVLLVRSTFIDSTCFTHSPISIVTYVIYCICQPLFHWLPSQRRKCFFVCLSLWLCQTVFLPISDWKLLHDVCEMFGMVGLNTWNCHIDRVTFPENRIGPIQYFFPLGSVESELYLSLIHIWRCRRSYACRSRWSPYH